MLLNNLRSQRDLQIIHSKNVDVNTLIHNTFLKFKIKLRNSFKKMKRINFTVYEEIFNI